MRKNKEEYTKGKKKEERYGSQNENKYTMETPWDGR